MECAEDVYDYLFFTVSSVKEDGCVEAHFDDSNLKQSIGDLSDILDVLDSFRSFKDNKGIKLPEWIVVFKRAYKHSTIWQEFYIKRNKERGYD